jgi:sugar fermentation stimulation protein A
MTPAKLIRRYKRFLADVELADGSVITVHTPNTGSMLGCAEPGCTVWLRDTESATRKYRYSWELSETLDGVLVGVNTGIVNRLLMAALADGSVPELAGYPVVRPEVRYGAEGSRIDLLLTGHADGRDCYVEIKNVTARDADGCAIFPDAVTARGTKHLRELAGMAAAGQRAVLFFCVQRGDVHAVRPADAIDPLYGRTLREAAAGGVELLAYGAAVSPGRIALATRLPVCL